MQITYRIEPATIYRLYRTVGPMKPSIVGTFHDLRDAEAFQADMMLLEDNEIALATHEEHVA